MQDSYNKETQSKSTWRRDAGIFGWGLAALVLIFVWLTAGETISEVSTYIVWVMGGAATLIIAVTGIGFAINQVDMFFVRHLEARKIRAEHRVKRDLATDEGEHRRAMMAAEHQKALREAQVLTVVAQGQVYISDTNSAARWKHMHAMPHFESNGHGRPATPQEMRAFELRNSPRKALASQGGQAEERSQFFPESIPLLNLLPPGGASLSKLIFGLTVDETAKQNVLTAPLSGLVHVAVGGESGWGKSVFLLALMFQVAYAKEDAEIVLIDPHSTTFTALAGAQKLRYQPAETPQEVGGILDDLAGELERRTGLYKTIPAADKLSVYNRYANEALPPIVVGMDETSSVFDMLKGITLRMPLKLFIQRCRKYGIYFISGAPSWRSKDLDTTFRSQFSSTVHFHARDAGSSRVLLGKSDAVTLEQKGHAFAILPGRKMSRILSPYIDYEQVMRYLGQPMPTVAEPQQTRQAPAPPVPVHQSKREQEDAEFARLVGLGVSRRTAAIKAYGQQYGGNVVSRGKAALERHNVSVVEE